MLYPMNQASCQISPSLFILNPWQDDQIVLEICFKYTLHMLILFNQKVIIYIWIYDFYITNTRFWCIIVVPIIISFLMWCIRDEGSQKTPLKKIIYFYLWKQLLVTSYFSGKHDGFLSSSYSIKYYYTFYANMSSDTF